MTCNVTGTAISPNGQIKPGAKITFRRAQLDVVSQEGSFVIPDDYIIQTALDGTVDFDILPGVYDAATVAVGGRTVAFRVSVPDEPAADFADLLSASYVEIPPASVTQAQQARDAAIAAQNAAEDARDEAIAAKDEAIEQTGADVIAAEAARDAAFANADVYSTVSDGRAAVADGEQFMVVAGDEIIRYRRDSSTTQTELARYPLASVANRALAQSSALFGAQTVTSTRGRGVTPVAGSTVSTVTFLFATPIVNASRLRRVRGFNPQATSKTVFLRLYTMVGGVPQQIGSNISITASPGAWDVDLTDRDIFIPSGAYIGFHPGAATSGAGPTGNAVTYNSGGGIVADSGGWYSNGVSSPTGGWTSLGSLNTTTRLEFGVDADEVAVTNSRLTQIENSIGGGGESIPSRVGRLFAEMAAGFNSAKNRNPRNAGVHPSPPTVTVSATAPTSPFAAFPSSVTSAASYTEFCAITGGWIGYNAQYVFPLATTRTVGVTTGGGSGDAFQTSHRIIYNTSAAVHFFAFQQNRPVDLRLIVDGQYTGVTIQSTAVNTLNYVRIEFGSALRSGRRIEIEISGGPDASGSNGLVRFRGWWIAPTEIIWAPNRGLRVGVFGDSLTFGPVLAHVGSTRLNDGFARIMGDWLGVDDLWQSGLSGTGWLWRGGGSFPNLLDRVTDITGNGFDLAIIAMGANDLFNLGSTVDGITVSTATIKTRVTTVLTAIRAAQPNLPVIVFGPWANASAAPNESAVEAAIQAGVTAVNDPLIVFRPTISTGWRTGTGRVTAPAGNGNADWMACSDNTHWTLDGHAYVGNRMAQAVMAAMDEMRIAME